MNEFWKHEKWMKSKWERAMLDDTWVNCFEWSEIVINWWVCHPRKNYSAAGEMVQWLKVFVVIPDDLSLSLEPPWCENWTVHNDSLNNPLTSTWCVSDPSHPVLWSMFILCPAIAALLEIATLSYCSLLVWFFSSVSNEHWQMRRLLSSSGLRGYFPTLWYTAVGRSFSVVSITFVDSSLEIWNRNHLEWSYSCFKYLLLFPIVTVVLLWVVVFTISDC